MPITKPIIYLFRLGYLFLLLGLLAHTCQSPVILDKYSLKYFTALIIVVILYFPLEKTLKLIFVRFEVILLVLACFLIVFIPAEGIFRLKSRPAASAYIQDITNYHPFLQNQLTEKNDFALHLNSFGFRGEEISLEKPVGVYRIFILGGSTVLSEGVPYEKSSARVLEKLLQTAYPGRKIEVLNAGNDWYTSEHSLIQYLFKIKDFQPDLIIMWHGFNDLYRSCAPQMFSSGGYKDDYSHYYGSVSNLVFNQFTNQPLLGFHSLVFSNLLGKLGANNLKELLADNLYSDFELLKKAPRPRQVTNFPSLYAYRRNLATFIKILNQDKVKIILGNQASLFRADLNDQEKKAIILTKILCLENGYYPDDESMKRGLENFNRATKDIVQENKIPFVDLESKVPKNLSYFADEVHTTAKGDVLIATTIFDFILANKIVTQ